MVLDDRVRQAAELYIATFAARTDAYSVWIGSGWNAVREPLTPEIVLRGLMGPPVSAYFQNADNMTSVAALDIDRPDGMLLAEHAAQRLDELGGIGYIEKSSRGAHFWIASEEVRPAIVMRRALQALVREAHLPDDPKIELRPASDRLGEAVEGESPPLGHCLRMPTMPHHRTGKRYVLVSSHKAQKLSGRIDEMVMMLEQCPTEVLDDLAQRAPLPKLHTPPRDLREPWGPPVRFDEESACALLVELWGTDPGKTTPGKLIRCPAHPDRRASLHILKDDRRAICFSTGSGCILDNNGRGRGTYELRKFAPRRG